MKKFISISVERKGQILSYVAVLIGILGGIIFIGSVGEIDPPIPTDYGKMAVGGILLAVAVWIGNMYSVKKYMERFSNKA